MMDFELPAALEASAPPEARGLARDGVRLLVSRSGTGAVTHHRFTDLPRLLLPGDLLVVNNSRTLPAAVPAGPGLVVHFSTGLPDGSWLVELRVPAGKSSLPNDSGMPGQTIRLPGEAVLTLIGRISPRLWHARLSAAVVPYLMRHGMPIRYGYAGGEFPIGMYQTVFGILPGSAEMPSAARPFTPALVTALAARGVLIAPVTLHCGVSSLEADESPYPEQYDVPPMTARLVRLAKESGGRVIAAGTTVVRALETAALTHAAVPTLHPSCHLSHSDKSEISVITPNAGWTSLVVTPETGLRVVDGLLTGLHEPRSSHLRMLAAFHDSGLLRKCYDEAIAREYLWHEFGDVHLLLP
jgi:S-adenosylmethionine:tRNA ribosyltransferase-isomerase